MPIHEVIIKAKSKEHYEKDLYNYTEVFRALSFDIRFGIVSESRLPIILACPSIDIPQSSPYLSVYGTPSDVSYATSVYKTMKDRLLTFKDKPATSDEFRDFHFLSCETMGHAIRYSACLERESGKRKSMFNEAYGIYEGVLLATCHTSLIHMLGDIRKGPSKAILFQPIPDLNQLNPDWRRMMSHCFAGMALCSLLGLSDHKRYVSLVSASICCEVIRPLELVATLRMIPLLMTNGLSSSQESYAKYNWADGADPTSLLDTIFDSALNLGVYQSVTENVLLSTMLKLGRRDLFDMELGFMQPDKRAGCERFAMSIIQRSIERETVPSPLNSIRTHIIDGKIIDRKCGMCGEWDRTGKTFARCSICMQVLHVAIFPRCS